MTNNLISWAQPPIFIQNEGSSDQGNDQFTVNFAFTPTNGNLLLGVIALNTGSTPTPPTGWTRLDSNPDTYVYYNIASGGVNSFTWVYGGSKKTDEATVVMVEVGNIQATNYIDAHASANATNVSPSVNTTRANDMIVLVWASDTSNWDGVYPAGYKFMADAIGSNSTSAAFGRKILGTSGATGTATWIQSAGLTTIAIRGV